MRHFNFTKKYYELYLGNRKSREITVQFHDTEVLVVHVLDVKHVDAGALLMVVVVPAFHASLFNFIKRKMQLLTFDFQFLFVSNMMFDLLIAFRLHLHVAG